MTQKRSFSPKLFGFLKDLEANNNRDWFSANKQRYEDEVREPCLEFINDFAPHLANISDYFVADSRPMGGSLFRIHRDIRFSKDKTPYKTYTGMHFRHVAAKDVHAPGFYLHLQPGEVFAGIGIWRPETATAYAIREAIGNDPSRWKKVAHGRRFSETYQLEGDSLKRPPKGFDAEDPLIEDLKRKDFIGGTGLTQKAVTKAGFVEDYFHLCKTGAPFMAFLCDAVGVPF